MKNIEDVIIGKNEFEARRIVEDNGYVFRITYRDGESYIVTADFRIDRINVEIDNGIITNTHIG